MALFPKGKFIVLSSPSGGGKSTIIARLLAQDDNLVHSISVTTRPARGEETDGHPYWFISREEFQRRRDRGELLEWEEVYGDFYGTPLRPAAEAIAVGRSVIFDLDVKGALKLKGKRPKTLLVFLLPPSLEILEERLKQRGTESPARLASRLALARWECEQAGQFDYQVINDDLEETVSRVAGIIKNHFKEA